jgi:N utilization substance protein B
MKSRHRAREISLQILYQYDLATHSTGQPAPQGQDLVRSLVVHYDHFVVPETLREFVGQLVAGTLARIRELDQMLEKHMTNWKVGRMSSVDRSLLRMSTYEMLYINQVPHSIIIDEAIELAKDFGTSETPAFINGVLDSVKASQQKPA